MRKIFQVIINKKTPLENENILESYDGVSSLGIQAYPGTKIYLSQSEEKFPIIIGSTGIYQVDLKDYGIISYLSIDQENMEEDEDIIIDILCNNKIDQEA